jgi:hypothetical protein
MQQLLEQKPVTFADRRVADDGRPAGDPERRQFRDTHEFADPEAQELAEAIDHYKLLHRRRFITYEELHSVITSLGYHK